MFGKLDIFDVIKIFFRVLVGVVITSVFVVLFWRMLAARVPSELLTLSPNDALLEAYEKEGEGLYMFTQEQNTITRTEKNYGYFAISDAVFIPSAEQVQVLVRYNDSTLDALVTDYGLDFEPDSDKDWYDVTLVVATDKTPENGDDNLSSDPESVLLTRIKPTQVSASEHHGRHSYRRLIFDGVSMDALTLAVYADFYYVGDIAYEAPDFDIYEAEAYGTLCLYAYTEKGQNETRQLSEADKRAMER